MVSASIAVMILSKMGYNVHAVTGKKDKNDYLKDLGAKNILIEKNSMGKANYLKKVFGMELLIRLEEQV